MLTNDNHASIIEDHFLEWGRAIGISSVLATRYCRYFDNLIIKGSFAGIMEHVGMYPLDTVKTHLQASGRNLGFFKTANILYKDEGLVRFWRGAQIIASGCVPAHASYFTVYEYLKRIMMFKNEKYEFMSTALIGASTTIAHDFFIVPSDVIKQRLQLCKNLSTKEVIRGFVNEEGLRGLYRSYPVTVLMNIPYSSCVVTINENLKTYIKPWEKQNPHLWYFVCAGTAGGVAGFFTNPLDVVKTRLQTQEIKPSCKRLRDMWDLESDANQKSCDQSQKAEKCSNKSINECEFEIKRIKYHHFLDSAKYIYTHEGIGAFTKGVLPRMAMNVPSTALSWGTYEIIKSLIQKRYYD